MRTAGKFIAGAGAALVLAGGGTASVATAQAGQASSGGTQTASVQQAGDVGAASYSKCKNYKGAVCLFTKKGGGGKMYHRYVNSNTTFKGINSAYNNGTKQKIDSVKVYFADGSRVCLDRGEKRSWGHYSDAGDRVVKIRWKDHC